VKWNERVEGNGVGELSEM